MTGVASTRIFEAWSDEPWVNEGAAVRVSLLCFGGLNGDVAVSRLDGAEVASIHADLSAGDGLNLTTARPLKENAGVVFMGVTKVGPFDVESFPRGYGEENDFCMRAAAAGFRNVLCPNAYVAHEGGVSFSEATQALMKAGAERLIAKHPSYDAEVAAWIAADPAQSRRTQVSAILAQG